MENSSKKSVIKKMLIEGVSVKEIAEVSNTNIAYVYKIKKELDKEKTN
jgi:transposase